MLSGAFYSGSPTALIDASTSGADNSQAMFKANSP